MNGVCSPVDYGFNSCIVLMVFAVIWGVDFRDASFCKLPRVLLARGAAI